MIFPHPPRRVRLVWWHLRHYHANDHAPAPIVGSYHHYSVVGAAMTVGGAAVEFRHVTKRFDPTERGVAQAAVNDLSLEVPPGEICVLVGRAPGTISRGAALVDTPAPPQIPLGVPAQLLERRPDVLAAEQGVIGAGKRVGVAVADRLPTLSLRSW